MILFLLIVAVPLLIGLGLTWARVAMPSLPVILFVLRPLQVPIALTLAAFLMGIVAPDVRDVTVGVLLALTATASGLMVGYVGAVTHTAISGAGWRWNPLAHVRALGVVPTAAIAFSAAGLVSLFNWGVGLVLGPALALLIAGRFTVRRVSAAEALHAELVAQVAAVLGIAETQVPAISTTPEGLRTGALPAAALTRAEGADARCSQVMPEFEVADISPAGLMLHRASEETQNRRALEALSGGLVTGAEPATSPAEAEPVPMQAPALPEDDAVESWDWAEPEPLPELER